jgi:2-amino-4-hydroxy-6-hydroxymethyldihydropteridine diphosphokinase
MMKEIFLSLGTNLGDRDQNLAMALRSIGAKIGKVLVTSPVYETEPWGFDTDQNFLNMALEIATTLTPHEVLQQCLSIEASLGRVRQNQTGAYTSRTIDIDVLFYGQQIIQDKQLTLPHPHLHQRRFILEPLCAIAPQFEHPVLKQTIAQLMQHCSDPCRVKQL